LKAVASGRERETNCVKIVARPAEAKPGRLVSQAASGGGGGMGCIKAGELYQSTFWRACQISVSDSEIEGGDVRR